MNLIMTDKNEKSTSVASPGPVYVTVMDIIRFFLAWAVITFLWVMLNVCPDCGQHHVGLDNFTPVLVGFLGAIFFHILRLFGRKVSGSARKDEGDKP